MTLIEFIQEKGDAASAKLFRVKERTAAAWRRGERTPRWTKAQFIEKRTNGQVTVAECFPMGRAA